MHIGRDALLLPFYYFYSPPFTVCCRFVRSDLLVRSLDVGFARVGLQAPAPMCLGVFDGVACA